MSGYVCFKCNQKIVFINRKAYNTDDTPHVCSGKQMESKQEVPQQATVFALGAMNAILNAQIQVGGIDSIHHMNFYDIADAAWRVAAAMVSKENEYREEINYYETKM